MPKTEVARKLNVKLLRKIQKHILEEPKRLDMAVILRLAPGNACKTAGCIDGWAQFLSGTAQTPPRNKMLFDPNYATGRSLLNLTEKEAARLFNDPKNTYDEDADEFEEGWPSEFVDRYMKARNATQRAAITAERIDHFIKTKGAE